MMTGLPNNFIKLGAYLVFLLTTSIVLFFETWRSLFDIWIRSETYTHGLFVLPASLWLVWQNKSLHPCLQPGKPSYIGLIFTLSNGLLWLLASLTHTQVVEQYALVGLLIGGTWFYLGNNNSKKIIFPLLFLYLMVPVGDPLIPYLMDYTATFTIALLRLSGISVFREGMHFSLVTGEWSVVEACSGIRYLIASITLGTIYAYITYYKIYKRLLFILASIIFPIIANGFRAYLIVMIGHLSDMQLAVGVDHLIYGAIFFAFIIFIMFYIGSFWRDEASEFVPTSSADNDNPTALTHPNANSRHLIFLIICLSIWPITSNQLQSHYQAKTTIPEWPILTQNADWQEVTTPSWHWQPDLNGVSNESLRFFKKNNLTVGFYQASFGEENKNAKLVSTMTQLINQSNRKYWHYITHSSTPIKKSNKQKFRADYTLIRKNNSRQTIEAISWYQIGQNATNNPYVAKIYQLLKRLTLDTESELYQVVFTSTETYDTNQLPAFFH